MPVSSKEMDTMWVLVPHEVNDDGKVVYRKCLVNQLIQKGYKWSDKIDAMYADFEYKTRVGLVTLEDVV